MATQADSIPRYQTKVHANGNGETEVTLYTTPIVKFNAEEVVLNTGGWQTRTTKTRMNQVSRHFGLGYRVFQKDFDWFVQYKGEEIPFENDRLRLKRKTGAVEHLE